VYRNRALLDLAKNEACVRCGNQEPGVIVPCHYHGPFAHLFGRGGSQKPDDDMTAHLCFGCHNLFDQLALDGGPWKSEEEKALEFVILILRTRRVLRWRGKVVIAINNKRTLRVVDQ
jgi:hypothetical protein